jgi:hypothetical protein
MEGGIDELPLFRQQRGLSGDELKQLGMDATTSAEQNPDFHLQIVEVLRRDCVGWKCVWSDITQHCKELGIRPSPNGKNPSNRWGAAVNAILRAYPGLLVPIVEPPAKSSSPKNHAHKYQRYWVLPARGSNANS